MSYILSFLLFFSTLASANQLDVLFSPHDRPMDEMISAINSAETNIQIAAYSFSLKPIGNALEKAAKRGVKIDLLVDYKNSLKSDLYTNIENKNITKFRVPVLRGARPQMHNKIIIIDHKLLFSGSANFSTFGLFANYENVMVIKDKTIIKKFENEINELKTISQKACHIFALKPDSCGTEKAFYDKKMDYYLTHGKLNQKDFKETDECKSLTWSIGLFDKKNQIKSISKLTECLTDKSFLEKIIKLSKVTKEVEKYVDGRSVNDGSSPTSNFQKKHEVFFSPEDDAETALLRELSRALVEPYKSHIYLSLNFITNGKIAEKLIELHRNGVKITGFIDKGRFTNYWFRYQLKNLAEIGFYGNPNLIIKTLGKLGITQERHPSDEKNGIAIFENNLTGPFGCNHNKLAIIIHHEGVSVINGSANWSKSAMHYNDENLMIIRDKKEIRPFANEILRQYLTYRYMNNEKNPKFLRHLNVLDQRVGNIKSTFERNELSSSEQSNDHPSLILSISDSPSDNLYAWVPELNKPFKAISSKNFAGKKLIIATIPTHISNFRYKLFIAPQNWNFEKEGLDSSLKWENGEDIYVDTGKYNTSIIQHRRFRN